MALKFYTSLAKGLELKVRKSWGFIPTFTEVTGEKTSKGDLFASPPILNRAKANYKDARLTLTDVVLVSFFHDFGQVFVS